MSKRRVVRAILPACLALLLSSCASFVRVGNPAARFETSSCGIEAYLVEDLCPEEKELLDWAAAYPRFRKLDEMTVDNLRAVAAETGSVDRAAAVFYHRAITEPENRRFITHIEGIEKRVARGHPDYGAGGVVFVFVPGMFYEDLDIRGLEGEPLIEAARSLGIPTRLAPVAQTGTVRENAAILADFMRDVAAGYERIIVATASKGGSDFVHMLEVHGEEPFVRKIETWFNVAGIERPSRLVDVIEDRWWYRVRARLFFRVNGYDYRGFLSMGHRSERSAAPAGGRSQLPAHIEVVTIIGVPLADHLTNAARPFYRALRPQGPNDGFLLLGRNAGGAGILYPAWRNDHYFQWTLPPERIRAFLVYAVEAEMRTGYIVGGAKTS